MVKILPRQVCEIGSTIFRSRPENPPLSRNSGEASNRFPSAGATSLPHGAGCANFSAAPVLPCCLAVISPCCKTVKLSCCHAITTSHHKFSNGPFWVWRKYYSWKKHDQSECLWELLKFPVTSSFFNLHKHKDAASEEKSLRMPKLMPTHAGECAWRCLKAPLSLGKSTATGSVLYFYVSTDLKMRCTSLLALWGWKWLTKSMYLVITNIFYVHSFPLKLVKYF